jgi:hypothetical protein
VIVDAFAFIGIPLQESDECTAGAQMCGQGGTRDTHRLFRNSIGIVSNDNPAACPGDPVEIGNSTFDIQPAAIWANGLADGFPPVVDSGDSYRQEPKSIRSPMVASAPEGERFELAFGDYDRQLRIGQKRAVHSGRNVEHVGAARRTKIFLFRLQVAGGIIFIIGLVPSQTVLADMI